MAESLGDLLEKIAAGTATPGGGYVSALCGALSVALSRMATNLAVGKQGYEASQADLAALEAKAKPLQERLLALAAEDATAYDAVVAAMRMPKGTDDERDTRKEAMQAAYKRATEVPLDTMRACLEALELAKQAAEKGNRNAITDVGAAALLAQAAMRAAALNVRINIAAIADEAWRAQRDNDLELLLKRGADLAHEVDDAVNSRL